MTEALAARDKMIEIIEATFTEFAGKVENQKRDVVESFPAASVYLEPIESAPAAARGHVARTLSIGVSITRKSSTIEDTLLTDAEDLERAVYAARKSFDSKIKRVHLSNAEIEVAPSDKYLATLVLSFTLSSVTNIDS